MSPLNTKHFANSFAYARVHAGGAWVKMHARDLLNAISLDLLAFRAQSCLVFETSENSVLSLSHQVACGFANQAMSVVVKLQCWRMFMHTSVLAEAD